MTEHAAALRTWIDGRADEMADLVQALVAIPTENPPGAQLGACASLLRDALADLGFDAELIPVPAHAALDDPQVVRAAIGSGSRTIYFHGHYDVVPAQHASQFDPVRADGRITGRGTADMKGGIVSMAYGAAAAHGLGLLKNSRIVLHLVCDEETGSAAGSAHLVANGLIDRDAVAMVTAEPTGGVVWHANRGAITMRVEAAGREAHVGQAHLGENAFEHLVAIAAPLYELARELRSRGSMLVVGGAAGSGANFNVVPGAAWLSLDRRFNPEEELDAEVKRLEELIRDVARARGARVRIDTLQREPAAATPESDPMAQLLAACVAGIEGTPPPFELCPGVLETRWYAQLGIPALGYGPGRLDVSHGPAEYVEEEAMRRCAVVYALFAARAPAAEVD